MYKLKVAFLVLGYLSAVGQSMRFDLKSGDTKCMSEDIKTNAMTVGKYSVVNPNEEFPVPDTHKITVRVSLLRQLCYIIRYNFCKLRFLVIKPTHEIALTNQRSLGVNFKSPASIFVTQVLRIYF